MDSLPFVKMTGAGNDFVVVDNRARQLAFTTEQIARLCDRRFGIGADGLLAVEPGDATADFRMRYYNADGGEAEMCGNGARCFARFVQPLRRTEAERVRFTTPAGLITGEYVADGLVRVNLTAPTEMKLAQRADFGWGEIEYHFMNTGVPHVVLFVPDIERAEVVAQGRAIRRSPVFPRGTNVNFVQVLTPSRLAVRTYERGVEDETLACGTGVTAAALVAHAVQGLALPLDLRVRGGDVLTVDARREGDAFLDVTLTGPAVEVFSGEIKL
jgi:diaminopimelate epimerase